MLLSLAFLAPSLVQAIAGNRLPRGIGVTRLSEPPSGWSEQFEALGLQAVHAHPKPSLKSANGHCRPGLSRATKIILLSRDAEAK